MRRINAGLGMAGGSPLNRIRKPHSGGGLSYAELLASQMAGNEVFHFPCNEENISAMTNLFGTGNGTYSNVVATAGAGFDGGFAAFFNGSNAFGDLVPANAWAALFDGAEGSISTWAKVANAGVWTDGLSRRTIAISTIGLPELYSQEKLTANELLQTKYQSGAGVATVNSAFSLSAWFHRATVWTDSGNYVRSFLNGVQVGADIDVASSWATIPDGVINAIGSLNTSGATPWHGYIRNAACSNRALSDAEIFAQYTLGVALGA